MTAWMQTVSVPHLTVRRRESSLRMRHTGRYLLAALAVVMILVIAGSAGRALAFDRRWRSIAPPMPPAQVRGLLGTPDAVGAADVLGKEERSDVLWVYWRGLRIYYVQFDPDTNSMPMTVYQTWNDSRLREGDWFPPRQ